MPWLYLVIAGIFEVIWSVGLKYSCGFTKLLPSIVVIGGMALSVYFLAIAVKTLPIGTAYAVWTGIGVVGTAIIGMMVLGESTSLLRIGCLALIILGIVGLKLTT